MKISVIIPMHDDELTIQRCVNSILSQSFQNIEVIIVDDGSSDGSLEASLALKVSDRRIKVFSQRNLGVSAARNFGITKATGDYVCFADADDEYGENAFQFVADILKETEVDVLSGSVCIVSTNSTVPAIPSFSGSTLYVGEKLKQLRRWVIDRDSSLGLSELLPPKSVPENYSSEPTGLRLGSAWGKFFKRTLLNKNSFDENLGFSEDLMFIYELFKLVHSVLIVSNVLYHYYYREKSVTHLRYNKKSIHDNKVLADKFIGIKNDYDYKFEQRIYTKVVICFWSSLVSGILFKPKSTWFQKFKIFKELYVWETYAYVFKNVLLKSCDSWRLRIIVIFGKMHCLLPLYCLGYAIHGGKK